MRYVREIRKGFRRFMGWPMNLPNSIVHAYLGNISDLLTQNVRISEYKE
jgi:hypothetical protein